MDVFGIVICFISLIIIGNSSAIYTRGRGIRFSRRQRSRDVPSNLKAPPTGQQIRLSHGEEVGVENGRVEVFIRDKFSAICDNSWDIRDADVVCKQIGFLRGAVSARKGGTLGRGSRYVMDNVDCDEHTQNVVECDWETPDECGPRKAAGVECQPNKGCPDGWIAGPTGCYQILPNMVTKRQFAVNKCAARGGHLLNIETEEENHFISHVFWNESLGPLLTGGVKVGRKWMWEKFSMERNGRDVETTTKVSIEEFKWFPGWQPGSYLAEPSSKKKDRCLFLSNIFKHPNGSDVNVGYHFWLNDRCSSTRKRMSSGFRYICERSPQWTDVGCFSGTGTEYRGSASFTSKGTPCMKWTEATDINPETYPGKGLGDHNNCRNPDNDEAPWCWISEENFEFCSIPKCTGVNDGIETEVTVDSVTETSDDTNTETNDDTNTETSDDTNTETNDDTNTETSDHTDSDTETNDDTNTETSDDVHTETSDDIHTEASEDVHTETRGDVHTESSVETHTEASEHVHTETSEDTLNGASEHIRTETSDDVHTDRSDNIRTESSDDIHTEASEDVHTETRDGTHTEASEVVHTETSDDVHTDTSDDVHGESTENVSTGSTDDIHTESTEEEEITCSAEEFRCIDRCIPVHWTCDMEPDCKNGEDEGLHYIGFLMVRLNYTFEISDYKLSLFKLSEEMTVRGHEVETYAGTTNETCAKYCLKSKRFVCRSFSFSSRTRECVLSHHNSETGDFKVSRRESVFELRSQLIRTVSDDCEGMFRCKNGRCLSQDNVCDGVDNCDDFSDEDECGEDAPVTVKLMGGTDMAGRVEVFYKGEWGLICDDNWDAKDAAVVCNMLGFTGSAEALARSHYGSGVGNILLDEVECNGTETSIDQCKHSGWKNHDCYIWEVAAVKCSANEDPVCNVDKEFTCTEDSKCISLNEVCDGKCQCANCEDDQTCDSKVKLIGGEKPSEGRVELVLNGIRGTICDDYFEDEDATVVCRMLGYSVGIAVKDSLFGPGNGTIWMDDVKCIGNETDIITCPHFGPRDQDCGHGEDVGVICETADDAITVELEDGSESSGRVILTRNGEKGTICDDSWDDEDATVICRMLGFRNGKALTGEFYGPGDASMHIYLDDVQCRGDEKSIEQCSHSDWLVHNCEHKEDAAVHCSPHDDVDTTVTTSTTTQIPTQPPTTTGTSDCHNPDFPYAGRKAVTQNGFECQAWDLDTPHRHKHHNDSAFPDSSVKAAKNYCRSPDGDPVPWCYTTHPDERWGYCKVPKCKVDCFTIASEYTGPTSKTTSGHICQRWSSDTPHHHKYHSDERFPDASVDEAANHCRSPDGDVTPWCYTTNEKERWEYCNVSRCGGGFNFNINCGLRPLEHDRDRRDVGEEEESYGTDYLPYRKLGRIYGGSKASYGMYPWQAGIRRRLSGYLGYHLHHCGGTIIGEYWVLSAAHCFRDASKAQVIVRTGDLNSGYRDKYEQEFDVEAIIQHERYNSAQDYDYDIALLKLRPIHGRGIVFNDYVQPACLPNETTEYRPGHKCLISGWGEHEDDSRSVHMKAARVPLVDQRTCNRLYKQTITPNMACAGYLAGGTDTCSGDSGGPLVCKINDKYTIMGVVSFGEGCAVPNAPGVYARVSAFIPWIKEKLSLYV
ncbi:uncharacterized protein LOC123562463 [Mercenaria mercenaria]|uniref:uncharacterized protein LOC123562463 n=1 Tax=Mercenaria mercenaria TaxID=6596 RepID=UPI00234EA8A3|nr:uncharacterized protein LOC123562463 [Mercenaria mercenaria]